MELGLLSGVFSSLSDLPIWFRQATIFDLVSQWEYIGVYDFLLPFLLIFAIIFGILSSTGILGGSKGTNLVISLVISLLSLRLGFVSYFFSELFPRFAIGLSVLIIFVILAGLFIHPKALKGWFIGFGIAGIVIGIIVVLMTFDTFFWYDSFFWQDYWPSIIGGIILIILIIAIFVGAKPKQDSQDWDTPIGALRALVGGR
jgi:hypothetical protein